MSVQPTNVHDPLRYRCGDDWFLEVSCANADGTPMDLTGAAIEWRLVTDDSNVVAALTLGNGSSVEPGAPPSTLMIRVTAAQSALIAPGCYRDRTRVTTADGVVSTLSTGRVTALASI